MKHIRLLILTNGQNLISDCIWLKILMLICWFCYVGAHSFVRYFYLISPGQRLFMDEQRILQKMVKLLAHFIDVTGKYYFHFMHDMTPHPLGLTKIDGLQGTSVRDCKLT